MKALKIAIALIFIICGILFFIFLRELNDPEVEGDSGIVPFGAYIIPVISVIIGGVILVFNLKNKNSN